MTVDSGSPPRHTSRDTATFRDDLLASLAINAYSPTSQMGDELHEAIGNADRENAVTDSSSEESVALQIEIAQNRPFHSVKAEIAVSILRTAALIERHFAQVVARTGLTIQQYNVLRILRGAGTEGMPTLVIRDRMIHAAPGITRLLDKLEKAGLARRERTSPDRRQVFCYITDRGLAILNGLDEEMREADEVAVGSLSDAEQKQLLRLLENVRARHPGKKS